jgi:tetratricopeptide (TPR) repeat protein
VLLLALLAAAPLAAQRAPTIEIPAPHPLAARLAAASEPLPLDDLVDAALAFSGVGDASLPAYRRRLLDVVAGFQAAAAGIADPGLLASRALEYLHAATLRRYDFRQVRIDTLLDSGTYNCVSSAVLYLILARSVGLSVGGVRTTDHAFCAVQVGTRTIDVETTNPYGYDPGSRKEFTDSFGKVTGFAYVPPTNYRDRTPVGERGLLALILHDRVSFAIDRGDHAASLEPAITGWTLSGDELSRAALVTSVSNNAVLLGQSGRYDDAVSLLAQAERSFGADPDLVLRRQELLHNEVVSLVDAGDLDAADSLLATQPRADQFDPADRLELQVWVVQVRADLSVRKKDYPAAASTIAEGITRLGAVADLLGAFEVYTHNAFAQLYNARRFAEAKTLLEAALSRYPASRVIKSDLDSTLKALKQ